MKRKETFKYTLHMTCSDGQTIINKDFTNEDDAVKYAENNGSEDYYVEKAEKDNLIFTY